MPAAFPPPRILVGGAPPLGAPSVASPTSSSICSPLPVPLGGRPLRRSLEGWRGGRLEVGGGAAFFLPLN